MSYIYKARAIEIIRGEYCNSCPGREVSECNFCDVRNCISAIELTPETNVRPVGTHLIIRRNEPEQTVPQAYLDAVKAYGNKNASARPMLQSMRFVYYEDGLLTVEFSRRDTMDMKLLTQRKRSLRNAFSLAFGTPVDLYMRFEGSDAVLAHDIAHRFFDFAKYGARCLCSACHNDILNVNQNYCAFCGRKLSGEVERV